MSELELEVLIRFEVIRDFPHLTLAEWDAMVASRLKLAKSSERLESSLKKVDLGPNASRRPVWGDE